MGQLFEDSMQRLRNRRQRIIDGKVNCLPSPFKRFTNYYPGLEQEQYICVTSFTKGGKSQFVSYAMLYESLLYCMFSKEDVDIKVIYFALEENKDRIMDRFLSWLLYKKSKGQLRVSPRDLRSTTVACQEEWLDKLEETDIQSIIDYFEEHVIFPDEKPNPTGIRNYCIQYAEKHGKTTKKKVKFIDENAFEMGQEIFTEKEVVVNYEQDNPNEYRIIVIDTINLIDTERNMNLKQSMDKMSEYIAKELRNKYHYTAIVIQQQAFQAEGLDALKTGHIRPSVAGLGDSKYISRDANLVMGLFSPFRFDIKNYEGYNIERLCDNVRFLEVIVNRDGAMGGMLPLWFDGAVCEFKELPAVRDATKLEAYYKRAEYLRKLVAQQNVPGQICAVQHSRPIRERVFNLLFKQ